MLLGKPGRDKSQLKSGWHNAGPNSRSPQQVSPGTVRGNGITWGTEGAGHENDHSKGPHTSQKYLERKNKSQRRDLLKSDYNRNQTQQSP